MENQHGIGAGRGKQVAALLDGSEAEGRGVGHEIANRVRAEGGDDGRAAFRAGPALRFGKYGLMAPVESVEIAQRDNRAAQVFGKGTTGIETNHGHT